MKKYLSAILTVVVCCLAVVCLTACGETSRATLTATLTDNSFPTYETGGANKTELQYKEECLKDIEITYTPVEGESLSWTGWEDAVKAGVVFSGWDVRTPGKRTLTITYGGASCELKYEVTAGTIADDGSEE